jgi:signal transduction histidine kinase
MNFLNRFQGRLYRKYAVYFTVLVSAVLLASGVSGLYFSYNENHAAAVALQREKAIGAAQQIEQYIKEIEHQISWTLLPPVGAGSALEQRQLDFIKLLRQVPAVTEASWLDNEGREQLRVSRLGMDTIGSNEDYANDPRFHQARSGKTFFSPVYFRKETEPYLTIAMPAGRPSAGVTLVEVNLKFVWDVVSRLRIGETGYAYVIDDRGRLISHPDISRVLQKTDLSGLPQVRAALAGLTAVAEETQEPVSARDIEGRRVLTAHAAIAPLGWVVFVEQPLAEAYAPLYASMVRAVLLLLLGLFIAVVASFMLVRRMVTPIQALQIGAARIGAGMLDHRIEVKTDDELETLAEEFNHMASRLQESYAGLEQKVAERTQELEAANQTKSRFLAAASHDLRQPMHALGLFVAQLKERIHDAETLHIASQVESSVTALQELLDAILDISRLDAGVVSPNLSPFSVSTLFERLESGFATEARRKGLKFRVVPSRLTVHSDMMLLERILLNLVANAIRYTHRGGVLIGCRRRGSIVRIEVWDTGVGIAPEHQQMIFQEFYQIGNPERDRAQGLGLGLAIVKRLTRLLGYRVKVASQPGKGSVFSVEVPKGEPQPASVTTLTAHVAGDQLREAQVLVVDDDALVQEAMRSLLVQWGCQVAAATTGDEAMAVLAQRGRPPDAILCDYRLPNAETGIKVIRRLRAAAESEIPAALISGDTAPERLHEAKSNGLPLLHKPVQPAKLRALIEHLVSTPPQSRHHVAHTNA